MRIDSAVPATTVRPTEPKSPAVKSEVASQVGAGVKQLGHSGTDIGFFPEPPVGPFPPIKLPPIDVPPLFKPDAHARATQGKQLHEIADGVRDGSVTSKEAKTLLKEQQDIAKATQQAMADGKITKEEQLKLGVMQAQAELHIYQASHNTSREFLAGFDSAAQRQAGQIDRLADGRTNGNITNSEAGELLGQQQQVADARSNRGGLFGNVLLDSKLNQADKELDLHSRPGTQFHLEPFPHPLPLPELPRPLPLPIPRPDQLPPTYAVPTFLKGAIAG